MQRYRRLLILLSLLPWATAGVWAQEHGHVTERDEDIAKALRSVEHHRVDTSFKIMELRDYRSLRRFLRSGHFGGHFRYNFMGTINVQELSDYYANGLSGLLEYATPQVYGFSLHMSGLFIFNVASSDFTQTDELTESNARYELQLFEVKNPDNRADLDRLEELYLQYVMKNGAIFRYGRMGIYTPLVNRQDTRMKPYAFQGFWAYSPIYKDLLAVRLGWFNYASPRSTVEWEPIGEAVGVYIQGYTENGDTSEYDGHLESAGLGIAGLEGHFHPKHSYQLWNFHMDNILNTSMLQVDDTLFTTGHTKWLTGVQALYQQAVGHGGHHEEVKKYVLENHHTYLYALRAGLASPRFELSANFLHIPGADRFVFPREYGREQFYATTPRGRLEGLGKAQVLMLRSVYYLNERRTQLGLDVGRTYLPAYNNYTYNKYRNVDYYQFNIDLQHHFQGLFKGANLRVLYVHKLAAQPHRDELEVLFYTANYHHLNVIANINF